MSNQNSQNKAATRLQPPSDTNGLPLHWRVVRFYDCLKKVKSAKHPSILQEEYEAKGAYPIIDQGSEYIAGWTDLKECVIFEDLPVIIFGDHTRIFKYVDFPFAVGADGTKILRANDDFLYPFFFSFPLLNLNFPKKA